MRNNATVYCLIAVLACGGCATIPFRQSRTPDRIQEGIRGGGKSYRFVPLRDSRNPKIIYSYMTIEDESYLDIINRQAKEKRRPINPFSQKRHIGFFGMLKETEREIGIKAVFPF